MTKQKKVKEFEVNYSFNGFGKVFVEAENEDEAKELFLSGQFENEDEWGKDYKPYLIEAFED